MSPELQSVAPNPDRYVRAYVAREQADEQEHERLISELATGTARRRRKARVVGLACIVLRLALGYGAARVVLEIFG